jgi:hypothetical protein
MDAFQQSYGFSMDDWNNLYNEASAKEGGLLEQAMANQRGGGAYFGKDQDWGSSYAMMKAIKEGNKALTGEDGRLGYSPEIDGVMVRGEMTGAMQNSRNGTWNFVGNDEKGMPQYRFRANPEQAAPVMEQTRRADDPRPQGPTIYDGWDQYIDIARKETEGLNRMPFVGPNWQEGNPTYGDIPYDPLLSLEMFYPGARNQWRDKLRDPLEGEMLTPVAT